MKNYYDILGVPENATKEQIKISYRKLSLKFHPDKNNGEHFFETMFKNINEAHEVLSNDIKRADYDYKFKQFNSKKNNAFEDELKSKEDELRKKEQELFRKEQEINSQKIKSEPKSKNVTNDNEINWSKIVNFFLVLNLLLIFLIVVTPVKDKQEKITRTNNKKNDKRQQSTRKKIIEDKLIEEEKSLVIDTDTPTYIIDSIVNSQPANANEFNSVVTKDETVVPSNESKVDSIEEKPNWIQFKKRREWKKKQKKNKAQD